jgi:tRNA nucleotidyltransferase (CCA-adding enzyme)
MLDAIDRASARGLDLAQRFACLMHDPHSGGDQQACQRLITQACQRLRVPNDCRDLAMMVARERHLLAGIPDADAVVTLFERCDAFRKPQRFAQLLQACASDDPACPASAWWPQALAAARGVEAGLIAQSLIQGLAAPQAIPAAIHAARVHAVALMHLLRANKR